MKKWVLSRSDSAGMVEKIESGLGIHLSLTKSSQAKCAEPRDGVVFVDLDGMTFVQHNGKFIPFLGSPKALELFPSAFVDDGAIRFLLNGADVMRPGIRKLDDWGPTGRMVVVKEEKKGRGIALGVATVTSDEAKAMTKGPCLKSVHYVGDKFWTLYKMV
jgi:predicted RNA-binding protein (TIGR00451 family)